MALYTISDLHLPLGVDKPMDIFGKKWENYVERLHDNWQSTIKKEDTVVLPGDFSWAMYLKEATKDFEFLNSLNGRKILLKGNHDYWWETMSKMNKYISENKFENIFFLHNNFYTYENIAICGTRGWLLPTSQHFSGEDRKIYDREVQRLDMSLSTAPGSCEKIVFTHYPPLAPDCTQNPFTETLRKHSVKTCIYGHLHANSSKTALTGPLSNVNYLLVSCDYLNFNPVKLSD